MSFSFFRLLAACLLLSQVTAFLAPQAPLNVARQSFVAPPSSSSNFFKPSPAITTTTTEAKPSTRLHASFGLPIALTASRPILLRAAAVFLASFSVFWAANKALLRNSIPVKGCPLFNNVNTDNSTQAHGFSGRRLSFKWQRLDLRLWLLKRMGRRPVVSVSSADTAQVNQLEFVQTLALPTQDNGLLNTTDANRHAYLRRLLDQAFTPQALSEAVPRLQQVAQETLDTHVLLPLAKFPRYASIDIPELCEDVVLDTVLCHYLGLSPTALGKEEEFAILREAVRAYTSGQDPTITHIQKRKWWNPFRAKRRSSASSTSHRHRTKAGLYLRKKIEKQMQFLKQHPDASVLCQIIWAKETNEHSINTLTDEEIVDSMLCLIAAGAKSTSQAMTTCLVDVLGQDPELYQQLVQEQRQSSSQLDLEAPSLQAVIDQALPLHPTATSPRLVTEPVKLNNGPKVPRGWLLQIVPESSSTSSSSSSSSSKTNCNPLPKDGPQNNTIASIPIMNSNNNEEEKDNKVEVAPSITSTSTMDSISEEDDKQNNDKMAAAPSPFGEGPRACLGQSLALLQLKVFLATLAQSVDSFKVKNGHNSIIMDEVVLYNATTETSFATKSSNNIIVLNAPTTTTSNLEYATTVTAEWMRDAIEGSPTAFS